MRIDLTSEVQPAVVSIRAYPNGPFLVRGPVVVQDDDGSPLDSSRPVLALCRCGRSRMAPLCDGSHTVRRASLAQEDE